MLVNSINQKQNRAVQYLNALFVFFSDLVILKNIQDIRVHKKNSDVTDLVDFC